MVYIGGGADIYRRPQTLESARVFSDPPVNTAEIRKRGDRAYLGEDISWELPDSMRPQPDGSYRIALRPHHLLPNGDGVAVEGEVQIAEISGSESIVRANVVGNNWVSEAHGIHSFEYGERARFGFDPSRCLYFDVDENLIES